MTQRETGKGREMGSEHWMGNGHELNEEKIEAAWHALPPSDKRFLSTLIVVYETVGDDTLRYRELPVDLQRRLNEVDRHTLLTVIVECLGLLLEPPALERIKRGHRERARDHSDPEERDRSS